VVDGNNEFHRDWFKLHNRMAAPILSAIFKMMMMMLSVNPFDSLFLNIWAQRLAYFHVSYVSPPWLVQIKDRLDRYLIMIFQSCSPLNFSELFVIDDPELIFI